MKQVDEAQLAFKHLADPHGLMNPGKLRAWDERVLGLQVKALALKLLLVFCHPDPDSYGAALRATAVQTLRDAGHELREIDLYAEGFDPVFSAGREAQLPERHAAQHRAAWPSMWLRCVGPKAGWWSTRPGSTVRRRCSRAGSNASGCPA